MAAPQELADTLVTLTPPEYVRFVADWMRQATDLDQSPGLTGVPEIDALVHSPLAFFLRGVPVERDSLVSV